MNAAHPTASPGHGCRSVEPRTQLSATQAEDFRVKSVSNAQGVQTNQKGIQGSKVNQATNSSESFCTDFGVKLCRSSPAPENLPGLLAVSSKKEVRTETNKQAHVAATSTVDHVSKTARKQKFQVCKSHQWDCSGFLGAQGKIKPGPANHCPLNICSLSQAWEGFSAPAFGKPAGTCRLDFPRVPSAFQNPQWNSGSPGCVEALSCSCILCSVS